MTIFLGKKDITQREVTRKNVDDYAFNVLLELGIPVNLKGFDYLIDAIRLSYYEPILGAKIVTGLYSRVAAERGTSMQCVEHAVRTALKRVDATLRQDVLMECFGVDKCPPPKKFINDLANRLRVRK